MFKEPIFLLSLFVLLLSALIVVNIGIWNSISAVNVEIQDLEEEVGRSNINQVELRIQAEQEIQDDLQQNQNLRQIPLEEIITDREILEKQRDSQPKSIDT